MRDVYVDSIMGALRAAKVQRGHTFSWFGQQYGQLPISIRRRLDDTAARNHLLMTLQNKLYQGFYCSGEATPSTSSIQRRPAIPLGPELERANHGQGYWGHGWRVRSYDSESMTYAVTSGGLTLHVAADECTAAHAGSPASEESVSVRFHKDLPRWSPGFYMALGDNELGRDEQTGILRLYWNLTPSGAVRFMDRTTRALNGAELPFTLKALDDAAQYGRCDPVVLYLRSDDFDAAAPILERIYRELEGSLLPATPALTKTLAAGLGLAESPPSGLSFGLSRCRALAEAMLRAFEADTTAIDDQIELVEACFVQDGIDSERPYLSLGSLDRFEFSAHPRRPRPATAAEERAGGQCLDAAAEIGRTLARQAIWHDQRCTWIGAELVPDKDAIGSQFTTVFRTLGPNVYSGTSGVALFMAELAVRSGDADIRRTALGAIRHALDRAHRVPTAQRLAFYTGLVGIACATARIGLILGEEDLVHRSAQLLAPLRYPARTGKEFDLIAGKAGAIVGLLRLSRDCDDPAYADHARRLGDGLVQAAERSRVGSSWRSRTFTYEHNLLGFSHGTAGVAYALVELYGVTRHAQYLAVAEDAFRYERHFFDRDVGNWPDFREQSQRSRRKRPPSFKTMWCHGAPGIALSRIRAYQVTGDDAYRAEAEIALSTTRAAVIASIASRQLSYALCHGLPGNADVLVSGCEVLGAARNDDTRLARQVAGVIAQSHGLRDVDNPSLMLGLAGVGYFLLRVCDAALPSVLTAGGVSGPATGGAVPQTQ